MDWAPVVNPFIGDLDLQHFGYDKFRAAETDVPTVLRYEVSASEPLQVLMLRLTAGLNLVRNL